MIRYLAFLRAINVGGHNVKMEDLRRMFEQLGFGSVETFIASGNVFFESPSQEAAALEKQIEASLFTNLGYEVATFLRSDHELAALAAYQAFPAEQIAAAEAYNLAFLKETPSPEAVQKLMSLKNEIDDFHQHGREIYWLCRLKQSDSKFSNAVLEKTLRGLSTLRGFNTIRKMTEKYPAI